MLVANLTILAEVVPQLVELSARSTSCCASPSSAGIVSTTGVASSDTKAPFPGHPSRQVRRP